MLKSVKVVSLLTITIILFCIFAQSYAQTPPSNNKKDPFTPPSVIDLLFPTEMQLKIPFIAQEDSPNCWIASFLMITEAARPSADYNVYKLTNRSGELDGTNVIFMPENSFIRREGERRTGQERLVARWTLFSRLEDQIISYVKDQVGFHKRPVLFCSNSSMDSSTSAGSGHCVVIVGYKGDNEITVHDPKNREGSIDIYKKTTWEYVLNRRYKIDGTTKRPNWNFIPTYVVMSIPAPIDESSDYNFFKTYLNNKAFTLKGSTTRASILFGNSQYNPDGYTWENAVNGRIPENYNELLINDSKTINAINASSNDLNIKICFAIETEDGSKRKTLFCTQNFTAPAGKRVVCPEKKEISLSELGDILIKDPKGNNQDYLLSVQYIDASNGNAIHTEYIKFPHDPISEGVTKLSAQNTADNKYRFFIVTDRLLPEGDQWRYKFVIKDPQTNKTKDIITEKPQTDEIRLALPGKYTIEASILKVNANFLKGDVNKPYNSIVHGNDKIELQVNPLIEISETLDESKYTFKATDSLQDPPVTKNYKWFLKTESESIYTPLTGKTDEINHTFLKDDNYVIKVQMVDLNGNPITENTLTLDVKNASSIEDEAKNAYEKKDWKKLFELFNTVKDAGDKRIIYDYIEKIAKEFNELNEKDLETLKAYQAKNDSEFNRFKTTLTEKINQNKDSAQNQQTLKKCLNETQVHYEAENQKVKKAIAVLEELIKLYNSQKAADQFTISFFENNDQKRKTLGYDLSKPIPDPIYDAACKDVDKDKTKETDKDTQKPDDKPSTQKGNSEADILKALLEQKAKLLKDTRDISKKSDLRRDKSIQIEKDLLKEWDLWRTRAYASLSPEQLKLTDEQLKQKLPEVYKARQKYKQFSQCLKTFRTPDSNAPQRAEDSSKVNEILSVISEPDSRFTKRFPNITGPFSMEEYLKKKRAIIDDVKTRQHLLEVNFPLDCTPSNVTNIKPPVDKDAGKTSPKDPEKKYIATISGLKSQEIFATSKQLSLKIKFDSNTAPEKIIWNSSPNLTFEPKENSNLTTVTFDRMSNPTRIWAEITLPDGKVIESNQLELEVISPKYELEFTPPANQAKLKQPTKVTIKATPPPVKDSLIDYRWVEPANRKELGNGVIEIIPVDTKPIPLHAIARVPAAGDTVNDEIKGELSASSLTVTAKVLKAKYNTPTRVWNNKTGLVEVTKKFAIHQDILVEATVEGIEKDKVTYLWSVNEDSHVVAGIRSEIVTINRSQTGTCVAKVTVSDKESHKLGEAEVSFDVPISQADIDKAAEKDKEKETATLAKQKLEQAKKDYNSSKIDEAIINATEATTLDPSNADAKSFLNKVKTEKEQFTALAQQAKDLINQDKLDAARAIFAQVPSNFQNYPPIKTIFDMIFQKEIDKNELSTKLLGDLNTAMGLAGQCKYDEAIQIAKNVIDNDPYKGTSKQLNTANHWLNQFSQNLTTLLDLIGKTKASLAAQDYKSAYQTAFTAYSINRNCPEVAQLYAIAEKNKNMIPPAQSPVKQPPFSVVPLAPGPQTTSSVVPIVPGVKQPPFSIVPMAPGPQNTNSVVPIIPGVKQPPCPVVPMAPGLQTNNSIVPIIPRVNQLPKNPGLVISQSPQPTPSFKPPVNNQQQASTQAPQKTNPSDGQYSGNCRFNDGSGTCSMNISIKNNAVSGSLNATIEGDRVSASIAGQVNPQTGVLTAQFQNGSIYDHRSNKNVPFTGNLQGTLSSGKFSLILSGMGGGPAGVWTLHKTSGPSTSAGHNKTLQNGNPTYQQQPQTGHYPTPTYNSSASIKNGPPAQNWSHDFNKVISQIQNNRNTYNTKREADTSSIPQGTYISVDTYPDSTGSTQSGSISMTDRMKELSQKTYTPPSITPLPSGNTPCSKPCNTSSKPAQSSTNSPPATLVGKWNVLACGYSGNMEINNSGGGMIGRINYHVLNSWENIINIQYNSSTGEVAFKREKCPQIHTGRVIGNKMSGTLVRKEVPGNPTCNWTATRM